MHINPMPPRPMPTSPVDVGHGEESKNENIKEGGKDGSISVLSADKSHHLPSVKKEESGSEYRNRVSGGREGPKPLTDYEKSNVHQAVTNKLE